ncbi:Prenylcysteine lyase-domain-containing protein [Pilobolus umbonatus]|nr:Prenylcysteine lyase-domain-containing protein [Pilobolus umbonatus]
MRIPIYYLPFLFVVDLVYAEYQQHILGRLPSTIKSVAIIGGGPSGTSAAYWLNEMIPSKGDIQVHTTLFERNDYLGGRSTVVPVRGNKSLGFVEVGASIFVEANTHLMEAGDKFQLKRIRPDEGLNHHPPSGRPGFGVWDGKEFVYVNNGGYWDIVKTLWKYGWSPVKFNGIQKSLVKQFTEIYNMKEGYSNMADIVRELGIEELLNTTAIDYLNKMGIFDKFSYEVLQSATRGNYCQDLNIVHALATMVSMEADNGVWSIEGGNYRIFEEYGKRSGADIRLNTKVISVANIVEIDTFGKSVNRYAVQTSDGSTQVYDEVILAAPINYSGIRFPFPTQQHHREYHVVYVTLVTGHTNADYFNTAIQDLPEFIVSTGYPLVENYVNGHANITTFSVHGQMDDGESLIKIFSPNKLTENELDTMFLSRSWTYRKGWHAFPELYPIQDEDDYAPNIIRANEHDDFGIIYTGAFEQFISTMETQTISGLNAVRLLKDKWCSDAKYSYSICK